jgi:hypothetical protein
MMTRLIAKEEDKDEDKKPPVESSTSTFFLSSYILNNAHLNQISKWFSTNNAEETRTVELSPFRKSLIRYMSY